MSGVVDNVESDDIDVTKGLLDELAEDAAGIVNDWDNDINSAVGAALEELNDVSRIADRERIIADYLAEKKWKIDPTPFSPFSLLFEW